MVNAWVEHVRSEAKRLNLSYGCAMTQQEVKDNYKKKKAGGKSAPAPTPTPTPTPAPAPAPAPAPTPTTSQFKVGQKSPPVYDESIDMVGTKHEDKKKKIIYTIIKMTKATIYLKVDIYKLENNKYKLIKTSSVDVVGEGYKLKYRYNQITDTNGDKFDYVSRAYSGFPGSSTDWK